MKDILAASHGKVPYCPERLTLSCTRKYARRNVGGDDVQRPRDKTLGYRERTWKQCRSSSEGEFQTAENSQREIKIFYLRKAFDTDTIL